ncbi:MAG: hypothetical protein RMJ66_06650 [Bacteroidia bacterium]|nr:hypothetical protein [Bacteroidia bacterium]MDW8134731.1 hypothetical protein [Bacteroidia bacterium]
MKRSTLGTIALLLTIGAGVVIVLIGNRIVQKRAEKARQFSFPDTGAIVAISLVEKHGDTIFRRIDLRRSQGTWYIGDTLEAFTQPVKTLLHTLSAQMPRAPVAPPAIRNVLQFLRDHRIEVSLYFQDGKKEVFYVGGPTPDQKASYMLRPGSDQPYEVFLPGLEGYVTSRYYPDIGVWQPNLIFDARIADLQAIQLDFYGAPLRSWRLECSMRGEPWRLSTGEPIDSFEVAQYLLAYAGKFYADELISPDSLKGLSPLAEMRVFLWSGKTYHWIVYPHPTSTLHYYVRLLHSPYFTYVISKYALDRLLYDRQNFLRKTT